MEKVRTVRTPSRLHLSLIDLEGGLGRVDGGVGISLQEPDFKIRFRKDSKIRISHGSSEEQDLPAHMRDAKKIARKVCSKLGVEGIRAEIESGIPEHVGLGSKTQLYLAIASGICKTYGIKKSVRELAGLVGRGGTSGIGVAAFEKGGFIVDGGHFSKKGFKPSRFSKAPVPPVLVREEFPWNVVCAWPDEKGAHGEKEKMVFQRYCPLPNEEVEKVSRIVLMMLLPAMAEKSLDGFGQGINMLQKAGFKKVEISIQSDEVRQLISFLQNNSAGGGMSSFGPVCFGLCETESEAKTLGESVKGEFGFNVVVTKANNRGAKWF